MAECNSFVLFAEARLKLQDLIQRIIFDLNNNYPLLRNEIRAGLAFISIYVDVIRGLGQLMANESPTCEPIQLAQQESTRNPNPREKGHTELKQACHSTDEMVHILSRHLELDRDLNPTICSLELMSDSWNLDCPSPREQTIEGLLRPRKTLSNCCNIST
ncbi:hypothetical protein N7522_010101 [Penicillium canescens]|uniref:uncharacterized protein n=1 Tax=Penicillium canescens TaxID=5083 RepID=UPI0026DFF9B9|nr:uncharacterized protein N7446_005689 [Penicillium canescens]KAJ5989894.1 hypothetical protein N7522_010101 [Penicillium canescens]KAJ6050069.1 hypothetical protein N7444_006785 [Penicillium canescens]KAJ6061569.1 hypothetical protein N7446_005689 [Penicillium canescens]